MDKKYNILIVDDDPNQLKLVAFYLKNERFQIATAKNGRHALETLKNEHIDLVLTDNQMPEMDGETMIRKIREELKSDIPVIIISANETTTNMTKMKNVGVLRKPFTSDQMKQLVNSNLDV